MDGKFGSLEDFLTSPYALPCESLPDFSQRFVTINHILRKRHKFQINFSATTHDIGYFSRIFLGHHNPAEFLRDRDNDRISIDRPMLLNQFWKLIAYVSYALLQIRLSANKQICLLLCPFMYNIALVLFKFIPNFNRRLNYLIPYILFNQFLHIGKHGHGINFELPSNKRARVEHITSAISHIPTYAGEILLSPTTGEDI